ncbi:hypothetical protein Dimus_019123 [Dionaea muscipula]
MAELPEKIMEEREELMVSPSEEGIPLLRRAHFLKPTSSSSSESPPFRPSCSLSPKPRWPLKVTYNGWRNPSQIWVQWVHRLVSTHQATWRKTGIDDAIMCSTLKICRDDELLMGIAECWSSETNTFVFPWGEATVTLEDVMVLAGYPVLGDSFFFQNDDDDEGTAKVRRKLDQVHLELSRSRSKKASHSLWMKHFMEHDRDVEHEAFLSLWLSHFVFPDFPSCVVSKRFFGFAIRLARGVQIALAPIVLASIYRDLTLLKASMNLEESEIDHGEVCAPTLWAPLHLVQVWAWERFVELRPNPIGLSPGQPRLARWLPSHLIDKHELGNVRSILQSAGDTFQWRPYAIMVDNLPLPAFYREKEELVLVSTNLDMEIEAFARCLRVSELGGIDIDCIEMYSPHRVAMQFGLDQDIPDHVRKLDVTREYAWLNYTRPIKDEVLFIPSRHAEADVTVRYLEWQGRRCSKRVKTSVCTKRKAAEDDGPSGFHKKDKMLVTGDLGKNDENCLKKEDAAAYELDAPPGFHKYNTLARENRGKHYENHHPKLSEPAHRIDNEYRKGEENCEIASRAQNLASSASDKETNTRAEIILPPREIDLKSEVVMTIGYGEGGENTDRDITPSVFYDVGIVGNDAGSSVGCSLLRSLVTRVSRLEKAIARLKEAKRAEFKSFQGA